VGPRPSEADGGATPPPSTRGVRATHGGSHVHLLRRFLLCSRFGRPVADRSRRRQAEDIRIDWATYNPVSLVLKEKGLLEKEFAKDGIAIRWVQTLGSNKALEFLSAGSIDFGSTAGSAALVSKINGNPIKSIYVYSRPEWTALVTRKDSPSPRSRTSRASASR
jgi:sulfonate transport system substrate-binding protein